MNAVDDAMVDIDGFGAANKGDGNELSTDTGSDILYVSPMSLVFNDVNSYVPNLNFNSGPVTAKKQKASYDVESGPAASSKKRQVLFGVSGGVRPGEVLALMGPSGSGKTSLLSILGGRFAKEIDVEGRVLYNGKPADRNLKRKLGFVSQDDLLFEALTVWETLWFTAKLRLPGEMPDDERARRVESVVQTLGLGRCKGTIIGGPFRRGVSGGERKRVSVGQEMLINPAILCLDEPTSGLDSTTALALVLTLRDLARAGRTILTTIHQPSSRMFRQLDKLLLLSQGRTLFYGGANDAAHWLDKLAAPCPFGVNLADHILDCASGNFGMDHAANEARRVGLLDSFEAFQRSDDFEIVAGYYAPD
eukprot:scaffold21359_cov37-Prasinocladus_malaysianus.AAC.1